MNSLKHIQLKISNSIVHLLSFVLFSTIISSCNVNGTFENRDTDKKAGEEVTSRFYNYMKAGSYKESCSLFIENFFNITDSSKLISFYQQVDSTCGMVRSYVLMEWKTKVVKGTSPSAEYVFLYDVSREKCKTKETVSLKKVADKIQIASYDVNRY